MTVLESVVVSLAFNATLLGVVAYLMKSLISQVLMKDLERSKTELSASASREVELLRHELHICAAENEVRYRLLHAKVAEVVGGTYEKLFHAYRALKRLASGPVPADWRGPEGETENFNAAWDAFRDYFFPREVYFPWEV